MRLGDDVYVDVWDATSNRTWARGKGARVAEREDVDVAASKRTPRQASRVAE